MANTTTQTANTASDPESWVDRYGDYLFRFALGRVRNSSVAEELVQETLLAALKSRERFAGKSSERSWLTGILKHKIIDHFRQSIREEPVEDIQAFDAEWENSFDAEGHWRAAEGKAPADWGQSASSALQQKEFFGVLQRCLSKLPARIAAVFALRELEEQDTETICKSLDLSPTNVWVILHRARAQLRRCLEVNWFGQKAAASQR